MGTGWETVTWTELERGEDLRYVAADGIHRNSSERVLSCDLEGLIDNIDSSTD